MQIFYTERLLTFWPRLGLFGMVWLRKASRVKRCPPATSLSVGNTSNVPLCKPGADWILSSMEFLVSFCVTLRSGMAFEGTLFWPQKVWGASVLKSTKLSEGSGANACDRAEDPLFALEAGHQPDTSGLSPLLVLCLPLPLFFHLLFFYPSTSSSPSVISIACFAVFGFLLFDSSNVFLEPQPCSPFSLGCVKVTEPSPMWWLAALPLALAVQLGCRVWIKGHFNERLKSTSKD